MKKILFINEAHPVLEERLSRLGFVCEFDYLSDKASIQTKLHEYFGVVIRSRMQVDKAFVDAAVNVKFIARLGVGVEHIDIEYAREKGIEVLTSPEGSRDTVGEHTMGMLLNMLNNLARANQQIRDGQWIREGNRGVEIKGKTVGILGYGNMGNAFAQRLQGFECTVIAYDKYKSDYGNAYAKAVDLDTLFAQSDILSIHIPYMPSNRYFVDADFIANFQKDIYIINTARGTVLDTAGLVQHLKTGKVKAAALDVLEYEEMSFEMMDFTQIPADFKYLLAAENVVLAPHIAGWSHESKRGHAAVLAQKIAAFS